MDFPAYHQYQNEAGVQDWIDSHPAYTRILLRANNTTEIRIVKTNAKALVHCGVSPRSGLMVVSYVERVPGATLWPSELMAAEYNLHSGGRGVDTINSIFYPFSKEPATDAVIRHAIQACGAQSSVLFEPGDYSWESLLETPLVRLASRTTNRVPTAIDVDGDIFLDDAEGYPELTVWFN